MTEEPLRELRRLLKAEDNGDHVAATVVLARKILEIKPDDASTLCRLGKALTAMANYAEAEEVLNRALHHVDEQHRNCVYTQLGHLFHFRGSYAVAVEWFKKVVELSPDDASGHIFLGGSLARQGKLIEAEAVHRRATECSDGCVDEAYLNLGLILRSQGRLMESKESFEKALELDPTYEEARDAIEDTTRALQYLAT